MTRYKPIPLEISNYLSISSESPSGLVWINTDHCKNKIIVPGDIAGYWDELSRPAYFKVTFKGVVYKAHRIIWFLSTKEDPKEFFVDHIDRDRKNNSVSNLRLVDVKNSQNNRSSWGAVGYKGVYKYGDSSYYSCVFINNKTSIFVGVFESPVDAALAWDKFAVESGNEFKILNFPDATSTQRHEAYLRKTPSRGTFLNNVKLKGVSYDKQRGKFQSYIRVPEGSTTKMISLGRYATAEEAAVVRDRELRRRGITNVQFNFPEVF